MHVLHLLSLSFWNSHEIQQAPLTFCFYISASKQIKFTPAADTNKKSSFVKKSALLTSGKYFRFNFAEPTASAGNNNNNNEADLTQESIQQAVESTVTSSSSIFGSSGGTEFKFNFAIDDGTDGINMAGLALK